MVEEADQPRLAAVSVKLPPFWSSDSQLWFAQVQAQFAICRIMSQKTMFDYVIASLAPEFAVEIRDLILTPPAETPYNVLKETFIKRTAMLYILITQSLQSLTLVILLLPNSEILNFNNCNHHY